MDKDRKKQNIKKISEVNSGLSPIDLYTAYIKSFEKRYKKDPRVYGDVLKIIENEEKVKNFRAVYVYGLVWSEEGLPMSGHFHATSVVVFSDGFNMYYMHISHVEKGSAIIELSNNFPYRNKKILKAEKTLTRSSRQKHLEEESYELDNRVYQYKPGVYGGIICQGYPKNLSFSIIDVVNTVLDWWYVMDVQRGTETFPGSCTGLTETVLYNFMEGFESCININGTDRERKLLDKEPYPLFMSYNWRNIVRELRLKNIMDTVVSDSDNDMDES
jgi:hypothetical protein